MVFCSIVWVYMLTSADTIKEGWQKLKLGEILNLNYGKGLPQRHRISGDFPVYGSGGIVGTHNEPLIKAPGIIIGRKGSIGEVYYSNKDFYPIDTVYYIEAQKDNYDLRFIYFLLKNLDLKSLNSDAAVPGLNRTIAHFQDVYLPKSVEKQKKISDFLSAYDDLIEVNQKKIKVLENIAQSIYKEWFVKPVQNGIPEGWEVKKVEDFSFIISRGPSLIYLPEGGIPVINQRCVRDGLIKLEAIQYAQPLKNKNEHMYLNMYDCLVNSMGVGTLGRVSRNLNIKEKSIIHNCITLVRSRNPRIESAFLFYFIKSQEQYLTNMGIGATGQTSLNPEVIKKLEIMIPKYFLLERFSELIMPLWDDIGILLQKQENLQKTRDLLIPKLVSGKIDLK